VDVEMRVDATGDRARAFYDGHCHSEFRGSAHRLGE
jgi:hypothetical protein